MIGACRVTPQINSMPLYMVGCELIRTLSPNDRLGDDDDNDDDDDDRKGGQSSWNKPSFSTWINIIDHCQTFFKQPAP